MIGKEWIQTGEKQDYASARPALLITHVQQACFFRFVAVVKAATIFAANIFRFSKAVTV